MADADIKIEGKLSAGQRNLIEDVMLAGIGAGSCSALITGIVVFALGLWFRSKIFGAG